MPVEVIARSTAESTGITMNALWVIITFVGVAFGAYFKIMSGVGEKMKPLESSVKEIKASMQNITDTYVNCKYCESQHSSLNNTLSQLHNRFDRTEDQMHKRFDSMQDLIRELIESKK